MPQQIKMTKDEAAQQIFESVRRYYHAFMRGDAGERIPYAGRVFDEREVVNLVESALEFWLTAGRWTEQFETKLADYIGVKHCSLVNSGSSANLLAFMALTSPLLGERALRRGDEVITVAAGFPTTIAPIIQFGAVPVFVDVTIPQYNIDITRLEAALSPRTKAVFLAHTLGNPFDVEALTTFCDAHKLWLIEDNCDALGSLVTLKGVKRRTGSIGAIGTSSFYPPHHITMGEGGAVYTSDPLLHKIIRSMRDWGRDCVCPPGRDNFCGRRFEYHSEELPAGYDHKYVYSHFGYNLKATDMQAAIGCAQLDKLPSFIKTRRANWQRLHDALLDVDDKLILPEAAPASEPSWFGFMLTCKEGVQRGRLVRHLEKNNIQTRMLFAGNIMRQPCFDELRKSGADCRVAGDLSNTDRIMRDSFWVGVYPGLNESMIEKIICAIKGGLNEKD